MRVVNGSMDVKGCVQALRELDLSCAEGKYRVLLTLSPMRVHLVQYPWVRNIELISLSQVMTLLFHLY